MPANYSGVQVNSPELFYSASQFEVERTHIDKEDSGNEDRVCWLAEMMKLDKLASLAWRQARLEEQIDAYKACQADEASCPDCPFE